MTTQGSTPLESDCGHEVVVFNPAFDVEVGVDDPVLSVHAITARCQTCSKEWYGEPSGTVWLHPRGKG